MEEKTRMYAGPMEGVTGFAWRNAHREVFGGADKYFTPFLVANRNHRFTNKEIRDISQGEKDLVPQILTDKAEHFIWAAEYLENLGYGEVNLNLGCPSSTVVTKRKGSGLLKEPEYLSRMLDEIFSSVDNIKVSIKTRIGFESEDAWGTILSVFNQYPIHELIVHPRTRSQQYGGRADREIFLETLNKTELKLIYNGDISKIDDEAFSYGTGIMAARGIAANPALFRMRRGGMKASREEMKKFHQLLLEGYLGYMDGNAAVRHMITMWSYLAMEHDFEEKIIKKMKKARTVKEYLIYAECLLSERISL